MFSRKLAVQEPAEQADRVEQAAQRAVLVEARARRQVRQAPVFQTPRLVPVWPSPILD